MMTYRHALQIQWRQMIWYRQAIGRRGIKAIRARTKPCPAGMHPDDMVFVGDINALVPRGASFERYVRRMPRNPDPMMFHWYKAMEKGKLYSN